MCASATDAVEKLSVHLETRYDVTHLVISLCKIKFSYSDGLMLAVTPTRSLLATMCARKHTSTGCIRMRTK